MEVELCNFISRFAVIRPRIAKAKLLITRILIGLIGSKLEAGFTAIVPKIPARRDSERIR
jgi:hypothetical protein